LLPKTQGGVSGETPVPMCVSVCCCPVAAYYAYASSEDEACAGHGWCIEGATWVVGALCECVRVGDKTQGGVSEGTPIHVCACYNQVDSYAMHASSGNEACVRGAGGVL
jgi:hypothetical protein